MAIFHFSVTPHSRSKGHSAVNGAAYRAGVRLVDDRTGLVCDYSHKKGVTGNFIVLPEGVEPISRQQLWDAVEAAEKRKNSTIARDIEASLPHELNQSQREELALGFIGWLVKEYGFAAEMSLHNPTKKNDDKNFHMHIYASTRVLTRDGFTDKVRVLDAAKTGSIEITRWREEWAKRVNATLAKNNINTTIDHRNNADRGITDLPTRHEGNGPQAARIKAENAAITELNSINAELAMWLRERAQLVAQETIFEAAQKAREDVEKIAEMPTLAQLEIKRQDATNAAEQAAKIIGQAKLDHERASLQKYVFAAREALPVAMEKLETAKAVFEAMEARGVPWYMPWRSVALERAQNAYSTAKTQAQDIKIESRLPVLEEVEKARQDAQKQILEAQKEREHIELQMLDFVDPEDAETIPKRRLLALGKRANDEDNQDAETTST